MEFASAKRIRLSINFDPDHNASAPPLRLPLKSVAFSDDIKIEKRMKKEVFPGAVKDDKLKVHDAKLKDEVVSSEAIKSENEPGTVKLVKTEKQETTVLSAVEEVCISSDRTTTVVKNEAATAMQTPTARRMDISVLCASSEEGDQNLSDPTSLGLRLANGSVAVQVRDDKGSSKTEGVENADHAHSTTAIVPATHTESSQSSAKVQEGRMASPDNDDKVCTSSIEKNDSFKSPGKGSPVKVNEDNSGDHTHPCVVAVVGSKKRTIIDDDSSSSDADTAKATTEKEVEHQATSSPPPRKKRKASIENTNSAAVMDAEIVKGDSTKLSSTQVNGTTTPQASKVESVTMDIKEGSSEVSKSDPVALDANETSTSTPNAKPAALRTKEPSSSSTANEDNQLVSEGKNIVDAKKTGDATDTVKPSGPASTSPTDPAAAPEVFDITCESCKKCYDMRYLDPPLVERPSDEWRCFECLVNDARGWPRRRKSTPREAFSPRTDGRGDRKRSSSLKSRSGSSSSKKSKQNSSKSRSSSSSKKKSSHSSSSKRKSSNSKSSSSKKSSSSSKKHKKRKASSSSHHRHSSSHGHHRRRHHSHYHHEDFAKLVGLFRERQEQRLGIEEARITGDLQMAFDEAPQGWRVVSSTLDDLRALIQSLSGGSLEQDRLRGRLILIVKDQEKLEEQRRKQQELAWNILPRRQSSRIAIGRMKNQSAQDSDVSAIGFVA